MIALLLLATSAVEWYERANTLFQQQRFEEAESALNSALSTDPNLVPALTLQGKLAMGLNRFDLARASFEKAATLQPTSPYVQFLLGFFHYVDNDFAKSIPALLKARELKPADARTHFYLALSYEGIANVEEARKSYERAMAFDATPDTHVAYGRFLFAQGEIDVADSHIAQALKLDPASRDAHYERGRIHYERGQWQKAIEEGEKSFALQSPGTTDRQIHFLLARAYGKVGNKEASAKHLAAFNASGASLRR